MKQFFSLVVIAACSFASVNVFAAVPQRISINKPDSLSNARSKSKLSPSKVPHFKVAMRLGLKGSSPISINTIARSGQKAYISEFSDDGQSETLIEMYAKKSLVNNRKGLFMDVTVTKRVRGQKKSSERAQIFAPDNQEMEIGQSRHGRTAANLSLAVMAHQL